MATIEKIDDKTIKASTKTNFLILKLNDEETKVNLQFDDGRTDEFIAESENGERKIYKKYKQMWIDVNDMSSPNFKSKLDQVSDDANLIYSKIYKKLSLYGHNEGRKYNWSLPFYDEKEFNDIYSEITRIQSKIKKMVEKNYKEVRFN